MEHILGKMLYFIDKYNNVGFGMQCIDYSQTEIIFSMISKHKFRKNRLSILLDDIKCRFHY